MRFRQPSTSTSGFLFACSDSVHTLRYTAGSDILRHFSETLPPKVDFMPTAPADSNDPLQVGDVVGLQEIAILLKVDARTPHAWQYRGLLPVPDYPSINGLRAWKRRTIVKWAAETGRLPTSLTDEAAALKVEVAARRGGREAAAKTRNARSKVSA